MKKDAYYFPHFSNARHDRKLKRVIKEFGIEGYGIYFMLLEVLRDQPEMKYPLSDIDLLADEFRTSEPKVKTIIANYGLFEVDKLSMFFSPKLEEYLEPYFKMKKQRIEAGKASGEKRKQKSLKQKNERPLNDRSSTDEQSKVKESKGEDKPKKPKDYLNQTYFEKSEELNSAFIDYLDLRIKNKYTMTDRAVNALITKLRKLSNGNIGTALKIIDEAIIGKWKSFYELKDK